MDAEALPPQPESASRGEVTRILEGLGAGRALAGADAERLLELAYGELRGLAARFLASERADHTLQPTALVNEAWLRLVDRDRVPWRGRSHFLAVAAQAMRRILVDSARAKLRDKRGGGRHAVALDDGLLASGDTEQGVDVLALDEALDKLRGLSEEQSRLVELRFFGGLPMPDVAGVLGVSLRSAEREWRFARLWLARELAKEAR